jgi:hypothetical protein
MRCSAQKGAQRIIPDRGPQGEDLLGRPLAQDPAKNEVFMLARIELRGVDVPKQAIPGAQDRFGNAVHDGVELTTPLRWV